MEQIRIDVVADVICPWCYLGKARLDQAIGELKNEISIAVNWRPFRLIPNHPPEGIDQKKYLDDRFGAEAMKRAHDQLSASGNEVGINFRFDAVRNIPDTLDAHRLLHWAHMEGTDIQNKLIGALFKAHHEEGLHIGKHAVLLNIAGEAGLNRETVAGRLSSDADRNTVLTHINTIRQMGVTGVPFFIIDHAYTVSGAQTTGTLANIVRKVIAEKSWSRTKKT